MLKTVGLSYESNTKLNKVQILAEQMKWNLGYLCSANRQVKNFNSRARHRFGQYKEFVIKGTLDKA